MKYKQGEPVVRGRASVFKTDIEVSFYEKHQVDEIFKFLVEQNYEFYFEVEHGDSTNLDVYKLHITNISWANNVTEIFKELEKLDYNAGDFNE